MKEGKAYNLKFLGGIIMGAFLCLSLFVSPLTIVGESEATEVTDSTTTTSTTDTTTTTETTSTGTTTTDPPITDPTTTETATTDTTTQEPILSPAQAAPIPISISSPSDGTYINRFKIEGSTNPSEQVTVNFAARQEIVQADSSGYWFFVDENLVDGSYSIYATVKDPNGVETSSSTISVNLDKTRPKVLPNMLPPSDMTRVILDTSIKIQLDEAGRLDLSNLSQGIMVTREINTNGVISQELVSGTVTYAEASKEIIFTPSLPLLPLTKYTVSVNPLLVDLAGNLLHPRTWSFTTLGTSLATNPHGHYQTNTNTCAFCHSTHRGSSNKLDESNQKTSIQIDNFCQACHDGTSAPIPTHWNKSYKHNYQVVNDNMRIFTSCASCHNAHISWTPENPNLLQDHYYFEHNDPSNPYLPNSSVEQLCESCHSADIYKDPRVENRVYQYKNNHTATGVKSDYGLCLRCHNNGQIAPDILSFYENTSRHRIKAQDGSLLDGHLACADCHNSHGSNNKKLLRDSLGHKNPSEFQWNGETWDAATERNFCISCHNGNTEVYGITTKLNTSTDGHSPTDARACHQCHGGSPIAAAHGPK